MEEKNHSETINFKQLQQENMTYISLYYNLRHITGYMFFFFNFLIYTKNKIKLLTNIYGT